MKKSVCKIALQVGGDQYPLNTAKLLIGSGDNCDIKVSHDSISNYQAMIFTDQSGNTIVMDLDSHNGTYINGVKIGSKTSIFEGDTLTLGKMHCELVEIFDESATFVEQDNQTVVYEDLQSQKVYVPQQLNENEILIDDEYCDIVFDDKSFVPSFENPLSNHKVDSKEFVETETLEDGFDIRQEKDGQCVQVTTVLNGALLEQYYFAPQDGTIKAANRPHKNNVVIDILSTDEEIPFVRINNGVIEVMDVEDFSISHKNMKMTDQDVIVITRGTYQIFVEMAAAPTKLIHISSLRRDKEFFKDTAKKFAAVILPMLLLLLVDFTIQKEKPLKQLSIIYKKPTTANVDNNKMASENPNDTKKDTGHKTEKQPDKKIAHSKAGKKEQPKQMPKKMVAQAASKPVKQAKPKMKTYKFDMATNVNSMFSETKAVAVTDSNSVSTVKTTSNVTGSLNTKVNGTSSAQVGTMGKDSAGRALASYGSKGLSSKAGRNTAYIQTKTVVLGSMDPELLRKILQQYLPQFRHCYQQELVYNSEDIKGIVDLNFEISGKGKVGKINVKAKDSRFSKRGTNCMEQVLAIIDFPKPKGGGRVAVRQPLSFFSEKEKG